MRLISLTVRNYRLHREQTVHFHPERQLIGGPNETGKSTLAEAVHRALFMRHRSAGEALNEMKSDIHNGHPEVNLVFEAQGRRWTLDKRFSGANGTARLMSDEGANFQGDAAEEKLSELTQNAEGTATTVKQLGTRWSHLWVWQGSSGEDPSQQTANLRDQLVQRLQAQGLAAVMQSATDERAREKIRSLYDVIYTEKGAVKANSRLDRANKEFASAHEAHDRAVDTQARLEAAVTALEEAEVDQREANAALPGEREKLKVTEEAIARAKVLEQQKEAHELRAEQATKTREEIETADTEIRGLSERIRILENDLCPKRSDLESLALQERAALEDSGKARDEARQVADKVRAARLQDELAVATITLMEKQEQLEALIRKENDIRQNTEELHQLQDDLAKLPAVSPEDLAELKSLESGIGEKQAALNAIAAGIECVATDLTVDLDGKTLAPGETCVITEAKDLRVGGGTLLRIRPGGGATLGKLICELDSLRSRLNLELDRLTIRSVTEATDVVTRRRDLEQQISNKEATLKAMGAAKLPAELQSARNQLNISEEEVKRRTEGIAEELRPARPTTVEEARAHREKTDRTVSETVDQEQTLSAIAEARHERWTGQKTLLNHAEGELRAAIKEVDELTMRSGLLERKYGLAEARSAALENARLAEKTAQDTLSATQRDLDELRPNLLEGERQRLIQVIAALDAKRIDAGNRRARAEAQLDQDGTRDPAAEVLRARAAMASALEVKDREQRHADGIRLLHKLFSDSQSAINEGLTQPIADRVAGYLEFLFGRGVRVRVDLSDPGKPGIQLIKPGEPPFGFESLSGGTKEQVSAAVRLATAEIIAAAYDGCLPILFDDAFAYADPARVQSLQSMLYHAASKGLQVIVLTCTPADYTGLGAGVHRLTNQPRLPSLAANPASETPGSGTSSASPAPLAEAQPLPDDAESQFMEALQAQGGSAGNQTLRSLLGWDENSYDQVKTSLITQNLIAPGRGRGGSVILIGQA